MILRNLNYDEHIRTLNVHCWMVWEWLDEKLHWNISDYGGVSILHVDSHEIWVPEIAQAGQTSSWDVRRDIHKGRCVVDPSGMVTCLPPTVYHTICAPDITYWPYDVMNCSLDVGAWMQTGEEITVNTNRGIVSLIHYEPNPEWKLLSATSSRELKELEENSIFPWIRYNFVLQRHSRMYEATVGIPALVIASLVLISFWISPLEENRINISCVSLICHCLYLMYLGWKLENNGKKSPLIVQLFRDSLLLSGLSLVLAITLRCLTSTSAAPPRWVNGIISWTLNYRPGQLLLLTKMSPEDTIIVEQNGREEVNGLTGTSPAAGVHAWTLFGTLLNRVCFTLFVLVYLFMFVRCFT